MNEISHRPGVPPRLEETPTQQLVRRLVDQSKELVQAEVALAKAEVIRDLKREAHTAEGLGIGAICGFMTLNLLLVSVAFALSLVMPGWAAALLVAAGVLLIGTVAGLIGWATRVRTPLEKTQHTLKEDMRWAQRQIAQRRAPSTSSTASRPYGSTSPTH